MIKNIIFDFDGVILDSMPVRDYGFRQIFKNYNIELIEKLIEFHNLNGGLSRFVKIRYFFEHLLKESVSNEQINLLANEFSIIMKNELVKEKYLIKDTFDFIKLNYKNYNLHIASGSEHNELNYLCSNLNIDKYFKTINGSPTHKNNIVENIISSMNYKNNETILIGDSKNDFDAAIVNKIYFYGFNNITLKELKNTHYIESFEDLFIE